MKILSQRQHFSSFLFSNLQSLSLSSQGLSICAWLSWPTELSIAPGLLGCTSSLGSVPLEGRAKSDPDEIQRA